MSYDLHLGPIVDDILFLKDSHRVRDIFNNKELKNLVFRRADQKFFSLFNNNPITENVNRCVNTAGFGGLLDYGYRNLDHGLLEAIIERWRPKTHVFHLPIGEAMVNLEDFNVLWGLPIEGGVVSGCEQPSSVADRIVRCHTLAMTQFGMVQHISSPFPLSINDHMKLHTLTRSGKPERNWMNTHSEYLTVWNQRWHNVIQGVRCATPTVEPNYMQWFWSRTMDGISQTYQQAGGFMQTDSTSNFYNLELLQNTTNQVMGMVNEGSRLRYPTHLQTEPF
ncbi:hypothetical protein E3N88_28685 [Mikania micrantha]|uniref:Aminotransferase-like plant mobile domain-containing protein n=1 Tax=Mikania micrantha TaxID=192012 RepID=A0A5N6N1S0_9ASTR|nr:hypothetical protein E3N88_28685 [Mikania micrantha]